LGHQLAELGAARGALVAIRAALNNDSTTITKLYPPHRGKVAADTWALITPAAMATIAAAHHAGTTTGQHLDQLADSLWRGYDDPRARPGENRH
jgi:hypothetical protein